MTHLVSLIKGASVNPVLSATLRVLLQTNRRIRLILKHFADLRGAQERAIFAAAGLGRGE